MSSYLSAHETIAAIRSGKTTAAELATEALERIQSVDQSGYELNSVLAVSKTALSDAMNIDKDLPLAGLPIFIKDNIQIFIFNYNYATVMQHIHACIETDISCTNTSHYAIEIRVIIKT